MNLKKLFIKYGIYIPLACVVIFTLQSVWVNGTKDWIKQLLSNALVYGVGYQSIAFAVGHLFKADYIAEYIGWKKGSPFQFEVGIANLAIGVLGIMCTWFSGVFWLATVVAASVWYWGCIVGHIRDMVRNKNFKPGSAGFVFYFGLLFPIALIVMLVSY
ncbi:MAG: hypothetical protein RAO92_08440 [Candidatus Euphemobacter frigidus]|nr:hypothetical protein [Candidatus Euphemobacter frigidus]MDP8276415.1 hypothetical protein [Candidatus Euphemobacter frigidus]